MVTRVLATVQQISHDSADAPEIATVVCTYVLSENIAGPNSGQAVLKVDLSQNDTQITNSLRSSIATFVNSSASINPNVSANDVRGLNL